MQHVRAKHEGTLRFVCELPQVIKAEKKKPPKNEKEEFAKKKRSLWESTDEVLQEEVHAANSALPDLSVVSESTAATPHLDPPSSLPVTVCGKAFGFKQQLQRHQARIHKVNAI